MATPSFNDDVYRSIYPGWDRTSAEADWRDQGTRKWGDYMRSQGLTPDGRPDPIEIAKKLRQFQLDSVAPAVATMEAEIPEIQQRTINERVRLESQKDPLKARYENIIAQIKNNQTSQVNSQTTITNNELGKRGILGSSTLAQQEIFNATSPIVDRYTALAKDASLAGEDALSQLDSQITGLSDKETMAIRAVRSAIAQLQAGASASALPSALNIYQTNLEEDARLREEERLKDQQRLLNEASTYERDLAERKFAEDQRQFNVSQANRYSTVKEPTRLEFVKQTDLYGNETILGIDPYTGKVISRQSANSTVAPSSTPKSNETFGFLNNLRNLIGGY